jgi:hypothetical protein
LLTVLGKISEISKKFWSASEPNLDYSLYIEKWQTSYLYKQFLHNIYYERHLLMYRIRCSNNPSCFNNLLQLLENSYNDLFKFNMNFKEKKAIEFKMKYGSSGSSWISAYIYIGIYMPYVFLKVRVLWDLTGLAEF